MHSPVDDVTERRIGRVIGGRAFDEAPPDLPRDRKLAREEAISFAAYRKPGSDLEVEVRWGPRYRNP